MSSNILSNDTKATEKSKTISLTEYVAKIAFTTDVKLNTRGIIEVVTKIKNRASFGRTIVSTTVKMMDDENVVHIVETGKLQLYGSVQAAFMPGKNSSLTKKLYSMMSFDEVSEQNQSKISEALKGLDTDISKIANDYRKAKILSGNTDPEVVTLGEKLQSLKKERIEKARDLSWLEKFNKVRIEIEHKVI